MSTHWIVAATTPVAVVAAWLISQLSDLDSIQVVRRLIRWSALGPHMIYSLLPGHGGVRRHDQCEPAAIAPVEIGTPQRTERSACRTGRSRDWTSRWTRDRTNSRP